MYINFCCPAGQALVQGGNVLGFADFTVFLGYSLVFAVSAVCIIYGILHWEKEGYVSEAEAAAEKEWFKEEIQIDEDLSGGSRV